MDVAGIIRNLGGFLEGDHFVYSSGKHGEVYINKNELLLYPDVVGDICREFAKLFTGKNIDLVVGPALGGIALSQWTAYHLSNLEDRPVLSVFAEKGPDKTFSFERGYSQRITEKKILIVDDLVNSSGSARAVIKAINALNGEVAAFAVAINRNPREVNAASFGGVPFHSLCEVDVLAYDAESCPFCAEGRPINVTVGHGAKFVRSVTSMKASSF